MGTGSADSPAQLDEGSQAPPSEEEGLPTGFAHGARPPGLAHRVHSPGSPSAETVARLERRRHAREWTESDDSPAVLVEASQEFPSAEGGVQGATTAEATQSFLASDWAQHFLAQLETNQPGARRTFEKLFTSHPGPLLRRPCEGCVAFVIVCPNRRSPEAPIHV